MFGSIPALYSPNARSSIPFPSVRQSCDISKCPLGGHVALTWKAVLWASEWWALEKMALETAKMYYNSLPYSGGSWGPSRKGMTCPVTRLGLKPGSSESLCSKYTFHLNSLHPKTHPPHPTHQLLPASVAKGKVWLLLSRPPSGPLPPASGWSWTEQLFTYMEHLVDLVGLYHFTKTGRAVF